MMRSGYGPYQASMCQSFHARTEASASSVSLVRTWRRWPAKPGRNDGKFSEA